MMCKSRQLHPQAVALSEALGESLDLAKREDGIAASWVAEYALKCSPGQLSKYRNPDDPDMLPAHLYPALERATGNSILWDALAAMRPGHDTRHARTHTVLASLLSRKSGVAIAHLIQAMAPDSEGGVEITEHELRELRPELLGMRALIDELLNSNSEKASRGGLAS
jgi:hypothetical protein